MKNLGSGARYFPLPAISMPRRPLSCSRRVVQRYNHAHTVTSLANNTITALNHVHTSFTNFPVSYSSFSHYSFNTYSSLYSSFVNHTNTNTSHTHSCQSRMLAHVHRCATRYVHRRQPSASSVGLSDGHHHYDPSFSYY